MAKSLSLKQALSSLRWKHRSGLWLLSRKLAFLDHPISKSSPTTLNLIPIHQGVPDSKWGTSDLRQFKTSAQNYPVKIRWFTNASSFCCFPEGVAQMATLCAYSQAPVLNIDYTLESPRELFKTAEVMIVLVWDGAWALIFLKAPQAT